jgi:hypothetical protein
VPSLQLLSFHLNEHGLAFAIVNHVAPDFALFESLRIADDQQEMTRSGDGNIQSPFIGQEAEAALNCLREIGSYTIEDDDVLLTTLKSINCVHFNSVRLFAVVLPAKNSQSVFQSSNLGFVG